MLCCHRHAPVMHCALPGIRAPSPNLTHCDPQQTLSPGRPWLHWLSCWGVSWGSPAVPSSPVENEVFGWRRKASKDENRCGKGKTAQICPYPARPVHACPGPYPSGGGSASPAQPSLPGGRVLPATPRCVPLLQGNGQRCLHQLLPAALHPMAWPCCLHLTAPHHQGPLREQGEGPPLPLLLNRGFPPLPALTAHQVGTAVSLIKLMPIFCTVPGGVLARGDPSPPGAVTAWLCSGTTLTALPRKASKGGVGEPGHWWAGTAQAQAPPGLARGGLCQPQHPKTAESWHSCIAPSVTQTT